MIAMAHKSHASRIYVLPPEKLQFGCENYENAKPPIRDVKLSN